MHPIALAVIVAASALAGAGASQLYSKWSARGLCANVDCGYLRFRLDGIRSDMIHRRPRGPVYLVIGDSLTERARFPEMCGMKPFAAGIGWSRPDTWLPYVNEVLSGVRPSLVVLALGTNDVLSTGRLGPYEELAASVASHPVVAIPIHGMPRVRSRASVEANLRISKAVPRTAARIEAVTTDGIHLTEDDYRKWFAELEKIACPAESRPR